MAGQAASSAWRKASSRSVASRVLLPEASQASASRRGTGATAAARSGTTSLTEKKVSRFAAGSRSTSCAGSRGSRTRRSRTGAAPAHFASATQRSSHCLSARFPNPPSSSGCTGARTTSTRIATSAIGRS